MDSQTPVAKADTSSPVGSSKRQGKVRDRALQLGVVVAFFVCWYLFSLTSMAGKAGMPKPVETVLELVRLGGTAEFWASVGDTFLAWMLAFLISTVVGIPVGLILGRSPRAAVSTHFLIDFLRTIPAIALIPLALLVLGPSFAMVVVVAAMAGIWPVLIQSIYAGRQLDPLLFQVSRSFRLTRLDRLRFVLAPDIMAFVWPGIRLAVTAALLVTVAAQLIGGAPGVGTSIQNALLSERPVTMFAYVIASALLGLLINAALVWLQEKLLWWHPSVRGKNR